jgi:putrescine transport system permease protein
MAVSGGGRVNSGRRITIAIPYFWLLGFFLAPFLIVLKISFSEPAIAMPPYVPTWDGWEAVTDHLLNLNFGNYEFLFSDRLYVNSCLNSLRIAAISTLIALLIGYPVAYGIARSSPNWRATLLMLVILPFWTSFLIQVYAWIGILKTEGVLNTFLLWTGIIPEPLIIHFTPTAVYIGIVYSYLPFMILPLYASL